MAALISVPLGTFDRPPGELLARTEPNIRDLGVAMVAGTVGEYTIVRREAAEAMGATRWQAIFKVVGSHDVGWEFVANSIDSGMIKAHVSPIVN